METIQSEGKNPGIEVSVFNCVTWASEPQFPPQQDSDEKSWESTLHSSTGSCMQERNSEHGDTGSSHLDILEAHAHNEI